ncbi:MAG: hypothetical protein WC979_01395 [Candidatus Pacearchaeota archaeon]|nr:hypothetical protein [Clostridia bacterium]
MQKRLLTLNEYIEQEVLAKAIPTPSAGSQKTFTEIVITLEFPVAVGNGNFIKLQQALDTAFTDDNDTDCRVEQEFGETGSMTRAIIHVKDNPGVQSKLDNAISSLDFHAKFIGANKFGKN